MLGQGALTSPGHFTNTAQPIARATARNRAIAQTRAPNSAVRSCPDHHPPDIHAADIEPTAHTTGCEASRRPDGRPPLGPAAANDRSSPSRSIVFSPATRTRPPPGTSAASRATGSKPPRTPSCCIAPKHASERFATDSFPGRERLPTARAGCGGCPAPSPTIGRGTQPCRHRPRPRIAGWRQRPPLRSGRVPDGEHGQHHGRATQRRNPTAARSPTVPAIANSSTS